MTLHVKHESIMVATEDIIVHQVNGLGVMGAGLALRIKQQYPNVFTAYKSFVKKYPSPESLLGLNLMVTGSGTPIHLFKPTTGDKIISNIFGQAYIGRDKKYTDDIAVEKALIHLAAFAKQNNYSVAIPTGMGCRLGGGQWSDTLDIIKRVFGNYDVTLYDYGK